MPHFLHIIYAIYIFSQGGIQPGGMLHLHIFKTGMWHFPFFICGILQLTLGMRNSDTLNYGSRHQKKSEAILSLKSNNTKKHDYRKLLNKSLQVQPLFSESVRTNIDILENILGQTSLKCSGSPKLQQFYISNGQKYMKMRGRCMFQEILVTKGLIFALFLYF